MSFYCLIHLEENCKALTKSHKALHGLAWPVSGLSAQIACTCFHLSRSAHTTPLLGILWLWIFKWLIFQSLQPHPDTTSLTRCFQVNQSHLSHCCPFAIVTASHVALTYLLPRTDHYWRSACAFTRSASLFLICVLPPAYTHAKGNQGSLVFCVHSTQNKHLSPLLEFGTSIL